MRNRGALGFVLAVTSTIAIASACSSDASDGAGPPADGSTDGVSSFDGGAGAFGDSSANDAGDTGSAQDAAQDASSDTSFDATTDAVADAGGSDAPSEDATTDASEAGSACAACTLVTSSPVPWKKGLVVDDTNVYWYVDSTLLSVGGLWSAAKTGGNGAQFASVMNQSFDSAAISGGKLWWQDKRADGIPEFLMNVDLGSANVAVAYDDTSLSMGSVFLDRSTGDWYWSNSSSGSGRMYVYHPGATSLVPFGPNLGFVSGLGAADADYLYGSLGANITSNTLFRMSRATGALDQYTNIPNALVFAIGADSTWLYFSQSNKIWRTPKAVLAATPTAVLDSLSYSMVDASDVFTWSVSKPGIKKATGSTITTISTGMLIPYWVTVDAQHVYFVTDESNSGSGSYEIWRVPR